MSTTIYWTGLVVLFFFLGSFAHGQPYVDGGKTRHRFAQMTLGADFLFLQSGGRGEYINESLSDVNGFVFPSSLRPRLSIGGTHFWGHGDFYISFPLGDILSIGEQRSGQLFVHDPGIETGFKLYPWRIQKGRVVPFVGVAYAMEDILAVREDSNLRGPNVSRSLIPILGGFTFQRGNLLIDAGVRYTYSNGFDYPLDRSEVTKFDTPSWGIYAGVKWSIETTLSAEKPYEDGRIEKRVEELAQKNKLSGFSAALGPSAVFFLSPRNRDFNERSPFYLGQHSSGGVFPELGLGYYYYPWDAHVNVGFRSYSSELHAFGHRQRLGRHSFVVEAYKFLFDYKGFVPFLGPNLNFDQWRLDDDPPAASGLEATEVLDRRLLPGLSFGWDIRPTDLQWFILRTNLRYTPYSMDVGGGEMLPLHQLEFNFIQLVIYPGRRNALREK